MVAPNLLFVRMCVCVLFINGKLSDKSPAVFLRFHAAAMHFFFCSFIYSFHFLFYFHMQLCAAIVVKLFTLTNIFSVGFIYNCNITS